MKHRSLPNHNRRAQHNAAQSVKYNGLGGLSSLDEGNPRKVKEQYPTRAAERRNEIFKNKTDQEK